MLAYDTFDSIRTQNNVSINPLAFACISTFLYLNPMSIKINADNSSLEVECNTGCKFLAALV